eukprot:2667925-Rhodomonas_salina.5
MQRFVSGNAQLLTQHPSLLLQLMANQADGVPTPIFPPVCVHGTDLGYVATRPSTVQRCGESSKGSTPPVCAAACPGLTSTSLAAARWEGRNWLRRLRSEQEHRGSFSSSVRPSRQDVRD